MSENLQLHHLDTKESDKQLALGEGPEVIIQEKYKSLVASRVSDLQSLLPIKKNSTEAKKGYESKDNYGRLRYAIKPFDTTPEYKVWKETFEKLKDGFIKKKEELLSKESTLFANKAELEAIEVKLKLIKQRREELKGVDGTAQGTEFNVLEEIEKRLLKTKTDNTTKYNILQQESDIAKLKKTLVSGEDIGYEKIIAHVNTKPGLVKKHYESQKLSIAGIISNWNSKNLADVSNPDYKILKDLITKSQTSIGEYNKDINDKKNNTQSSVRKINQENSTISTLNAGKYSAFGEYLTNNLLIQSYGGLNKESDRANADLQYGVYDLMLDDLKDVSLDFIDNFYDKEWKDHMSGAVSNSMSDMGVTYLDDQDPQSLGLEKVRVTGMSSAFTNWKQTLYRNVRDFYDSTYDKEIRSSYWSADPIGLQNEIKSIKPEAKDLQDPNFKDTTSHYALYSAYKNQNDTISTIRNKVIGARDAAQKYKTYVYDFVNFESKSIQRGYLEQVHNFISPQYKVANEILGNSNTEIAKLQKTKGSSVDEKIKKLDAEYPQVVSMIKERRDPSNDQERLQRKEYMSKRRTIEQSLGSLESSLRTQQQLRDENSELAKNIKPIADAYSTAFNTYKKPEKSPLTVSYSNDEYPLTIADLGDIKPSAPIDFAGVLDFVTKDATPESPKIPETPKN